MMARSRHSRHLVPVLLIALAAPAGCARNGPPAPVDMHGAARMPPKSVARPPALPPPALVRQAHLPHADKIDVGAGETLYAISRRYDVPLRSIIEANALQPPYRLTRGSTLILPQQRFHVVQPGDTLYGISRLYGVELSTLATTNHLDAPYALRRGETLYLPPAVEPAESVATEALPPVPPPVANAAPAEPAAPIPSERPKPPAETTAQLAVPPRAGKGFVWPVQGRILSAYGTGPGGTHNDGINIAVRMGEPVRAADGGVVAYAGNALRGYGNLLLIKHPGGWMTAYAHNETLLVRRGDSVKRGQEIAKAGATGVVSEPQLHFEIRRGSHALDPAEYLPAVRASAE